jgi:hypothetical protein
VCRTFALWVVTMRTPQPYGVFRSGNHVLTCELRRTVTVWLCVKLEHGELSPDRMKARLLPKFIMTITVRSQA